MKDDERHRSAAASKDQKIEAAKEVAKKGGKREPQPGDTPEEERPQTQKLVVDGTDG